MSLITNLKHSFFRNPMLFGLFILSVTAIFSSGYDFADEHFQILEFANYKLGNTTATTLPWEFEAQMRPALQPFIAYVIIKFMNMLSLSNPFLIAGILRLISVIIAMIAIRLLHKAITSLTDYKISSDLLYGFFILSWFFPYNFVRFSSENWSGAFFAMGLALYLMSKKSKNSILLVSGILCGLSFLFRYQTAFMTVGLGLWMIFIARDKFKSISLFAAGNIISILTGILIDKWFYGNWVLSFWNYIDFNLIQDKVSEFGILPWWFYFEAVFNKAAPPFGILLIISFLWVCIRFPKNIITWVSIPFVLIHFIIGHKELRFLYPLMYLIPVFICLFIISIKDYKFIQQLISRKFTKVVIAFFITLNIVLLAIMCFKPADEMISLYRRVYNIAETGKTELIIAGNENPYFRGGKNLAVTYYKNPNISFRQLQSADMLSNTLLKDTLNIRYLYAVKKFDARSRFEMNNLHFSKIYQTYPQWVENFNINNWMSRTKVWTIYEVKK